jgi:hypothetical protein
VFPDAPDVGIAGEDDDQVTSAQSLLYASPSDITIERVRALVRQAGPESPTVEYKEQMADTIARGVAALANTYGGLLLVGVSDDRIVRGVREKTIEAVAEHCAAKIEPPWVPEIVPVPLGQGSGLYVLVLRVVRGRHPRPLLVDGIAWVRHQNTTHPADWQRLRDLFAESSAAIQDDAWNLQAPNVPQAADGTPDSTVDFVLRSGLGFRIAPEAKWRPLSDSAVTALTEVLNKSSLQAMLSRLSTEGAPPGRLDPFHRRGLNRSRQARLVWRGAPAGWPDDRAGPVIANVRLEVPGGYGMPGTHLQLETDVTVRYSLAAEIARECPGNEAAVSPRWRVRPHHLGEIVGAVLATLAGTDVAGPLAGLGGIDPLAVPQPRVMHMVTARPVTEVLDTTGLTPIPSAGNSMGAHLLADPALDLADDKDREEQVRRWLAQIALDAGLTGMEQALEYQ